MASQELTARLRYLNDSAHLLATCAPATSKYLMAQCNSLMLDNDIELPESHKRKVCGACGTIMILGWDSKLEVEQRRGRVRGKSVSGKAGTDWARAMVYECDSCGRKTRVNISTTPKAVPKQKHPLPQTKHTLSVNQASTNCSTSTPSRISTGKKRRKESGLEAILARQKATESRAPLGFDLLDFMKK
jgi:ribonuclease MRP protein subunit SNM1